MQNEPIFEARVKKMHWLPLDKRSHGTSGSGGGETREGFAEHRMIRRSADSTFHRGSEEAAFESGAKEKRPAGENEAGLKDGEDSEVAGVLWPAGLEVRHGQVSFRHQQ
jgi:hypothetical protein